MAENFDREVNLLNVLNGDENQEIEKHNNNNSMILTKSLIKELIVLFFSISSHLSSNSFISDLVKIIELLLLSFSIS